MKCSGIAEYVLHISTLYFWVYGNDGGWFVSFILVFYIAFPLIYRIISIDRTSIKYTCITLGVLALTLISLYVYLYMPSLSERIGIALYRVPALLIGVCFGCLSYDNKKINIFWVLPVFGIVLSRQLFHFPDDGLAYYWPNTCKSILYMIIIVGGLVILGKTKVTRKIVTCLSALGELSLEIYLIHMMALMLLGTYGLKDFQYINIVWYMIMILSIALAKLVSIAKKKIINRIKIA